MPLSTRLLDDKRIWGYDKKGLYSVNLPTNDDLSRRGIDAGDEKGMVIFTCKTEVKEVGSTTLMEGIAVRYGLNMALLQNISNLYVQSDNQNLIRGLHGDVELDPYSEVIKGDILAVARRVHVIDFNFIPRACNRVAHLLSRCPNFEGVNFIHKNILTIVSEETS
ncbi:hypothetical protein SASPL_130829 [Salvia splendens]|uniref:RNase H type-1 domain-containing protein n=1 Tax=Salvia splendens TaxID=180675 RepID=A0A8X8X6R7_SALSN|nr:hypothetical protein SASPL_130829 [Salvia splendens]